jgi:hypothetical protein
MVQSGFFPIRSLALIWLLAASERERDCSKGALCVHYVCALITQAITLDLQIMRLFCSLEWNSSLLNSVISINYLFLISVNDRDSDPWIHSQQRQQVILGGACMHKHHIKSSSSLSRSLSFGFASVVKVTRETAVKNWD